MNTQQLIHSLASDLQASSGPSHVAPRMVAPGRA